RVSGAVGTALLAVFLQRAIAARAPGQHGGLQRIATLPHGQHLHLAGTLADAFGRTFWIAAGLTAAAIIPASLLPTRPPAAPASHQESDTAEAYAVNACQQAWSDNDHKHPRGTRIHPRRQSGAYPEPARPEGQRRVHKRPADSPLLPTRRRPAEAHAQPRGREHLPARRPASC